MQLNVFTSLDLIDWMYKKKISSEVSSNEYLG